MTFLNTTSNLSEENENLKRVIAVLVRQMGGYAFLSSSEVEETRGMNLSIETAIDPWGMKIKVEP